jgi:hypothetical protein
MEIVFGLNADGAPDRFLVVVDDVHWLDQTSALTADSAASVSR